jgi:hypothetical protein
MCDSEGGGAELHPMYPRQLGLRAPQHRTARLHISSGYSLWILRHFACGNRGQSRVEQGSPVLQPCSPS